MASLQAALQQNYLEHPRFGPLAVPWRLDRDLVRAFEAAYAKALRDPTTASRASCRRGLEGVFAALAPQAVDQNEGAFLAQLRIACLRFVDEELDAAKRPASRRRAVWERKAGAQVARLRDVRHVFGKLSPDTVADILAIGGGDLAEFRRRAQAGRLTRDDLSLTTGWKTVRIRRILNREFARLGVLDAVSAYMGRRFRVTGLALELSVPQATWWKSAFDDLKRPPRTLYAHLDESTLLPKAIVYLSDVTPANGPTSCYPHAFEDLGLTPLQDVVGRVLGNVGNQPPLSRYYVKAYHQSMSSEAFRRHFMRLPAAMRFNSHVGWDVLPDGELENRLAPREVAMLGPAGTFIAFDGGRLLHRGGLMQSGERVALQVVLSDAGLVRRALARLRRR